MTAAVVPPHLHPHHVPCRCHRLVVTHASTVTILGGSNIHPWPVTRLLTPNSIHPDSIHPDLFHPDSIHPIPFTPIYFTKIQFTQFHSPQFNSPRFNSPISIHPNSILPNSFHPNSVHPISLAPLHPPEHRCLMLSLPPPFNRTLPLIRALLPTRNLIQTLILTT